MIILTKKSEERGKGHMRGKPPPQTRPPTTPQYFSTFFHMKKPLFAKGFFYKV
jgi:hypothetical protein